MRGVIQPVRHVLSKNGTRVRDQGQKLPLETKFYDSQKRVEVTAFSCLFYICYVLGTKSRNFFNTVEAQPKTLPQK